MARSNDVQYVRFYSYGSAAEKVELPAKEKKKKTLPKSKLEQVGKSIEKMDSMALTGIVVAAVMLLLMLVGFAQVQIANEQLRDAQMRVALLEAENDRLRTEYEHGYDLAEIRVTAEAMGMVPVEQVRHVTVKISEPVAVEEITWWEQWILDFKALFA